MKPSRARMIPKKVHKLFERFSMQESLRLRAVKSASVRFAEVIENKEWDLGRKLRGRSACVELNESSVPNSPPKARKNWHQLISRLLNEIEGKKSFLAPTLVNCWIVRKGSRVDLLSSTPVNQFSLCDACYPEIVGISFLLETGAGLKDALWGVTCLPEGSRRSGLSNNKIAVGINQHSQGHPKTHKHAPN